MFHHTRQTLKHTIALNIRRLKYGVPKEKVFCIGFQKTGTTSLQYALSLLGYRVAEVFGVKDLETPDQMRGRALSLLPKFDAFADNPWPLYFREFDAMFPDAKFILTTRDPEKWYTSVCKHFGNKPIRMHEWIYGVPAPVGNQEIYFEKLLSHQEAVRAHFADSPGVLLEFDVAAGHGWTELCGFLDRPVPRRDFPKLNTSTMRG
jgi:hypothetical protein